MLTKQIDWQGYNRFILERIASDGLMIGTVQAIDEEGNVTKSDNNIGFQPDNMPCEITDVDLAYFDNGIDEDYVMGCTVAELDELGVLLGIELSGLKADNQAQILAAL